MAAGRRNNVGGILNAAGDELTRTRPLEDGGEEGRLACSRDAAILRVRHVYVTLPEDECIMEDVSLIADERKVLSRPPLTAGPFYVS